LAALTPYGGQFDDLDSKHRRPHSAATNLVDPAVKPPIKQERC